MPLNLPFAETPAKILMIAVLASVHHCLKAGLSLKQSISDYSYKYVTYDIVTNYVPYGIVRNVASTSQHTAMQQLYLCSAVMASVTIVTLAFSLLFFALLRM